VSIEVFACPSGFQRSIVHRHRLGVGYI